MLQLSTKIIQELVNSTARPAISLYLSTHRHYPGTEKDPIVFKNLVKDVGLALEKNYPEANKQKIIDHLIHYETDRQFWAHQLDGLAIFVADDFVKVIKVAAAFPSKVVVSDTFYVTPLIRALQSNDRYQVLCLSRTNVTVYEGNRYQLDDITSNKIPRNLEAALGTELTEPHLTVSSYNGSRPSINGTSNSAMHHGHGDKSSEDEKEIVNFFRAVDRTVLNEPSQPSGLPLIVVTFPEYFSVFKSISHNKQLFENGVSMHPDAFNKEDLILKAWSVFEPIYTERISTAISSYNIANAYKAASDSLEEVAIAAVSGKIATLLIEEDRQIAGKIGDSSGELQLGFGSDTNAQNDVLDDIAEKVILTGGKVLVIPHSKMPSSSGLAATFRY